jgi:hypothetical protein
VVCHREESDVGSSTARKVCLIEPTDGVGMHSKVCLWLGLLSLPRWMSPWQSAAWQ